MELFIDIDFLQDFQKDCDANPNNPIKKIVKNIVTNYGDKKVYINYNENDFEKLKKEYEIFALICNTTVPNPIDSIEDAVKKSKLAQTLIFTRNKKEWFFEIENRGALCFCIDNYEQNIKSIIDNLHFKIDLSEPLNGWRFLDVFKTINYNKIIINDGYVLGDKSGQKIEDNIIPILKKIVPYKNNNLSITFLTKDLSPNRVVSPITPEKIKQKIKEKARKRFKKLTQIFPKDQIKFSIVNSNLSKESGVESFNMHDRNILTNFSLMDSGLGFNLFPYESSNSQLVSETIFDKYTYNRLNNILKKQKKYIEDISILDKNYFKIFPE
jgi:tetratricopeptide (TPR) repeat protein